MESTDKVRRALGIPPRRMKNLLYRSMPAGAVVLVLVVSALSLIIVAHEGSHYAAALLAGIAPDAVRIDACGVNPCLMLSARPAGWQASVMDYAGGLTAAAVGGVIYLTVLGRQRTQHQARWWLAGSIVASMTGEQLGAAAAEGAFHAQYVAQKTVTDLVQYGGALCGVMLHVVLAPIPPTFQRTAAIDPTNGH